ncbi:hypothetical protein PHISCL_06118 [Aspergillus sclerotialis]|uniref:Zn(2)-C6 fungal-type domain-containing protein n=1 Tax=Aspergillus sclerotialis TaxID=2070753 RepID=A0A3A2ZF10_9EURO|nr:hypothetical protein PHISCL_06118 [Aspergillus sclerotialis]
MAETSGGTPTGWRISKACQECRKRKIRCNGLNPCKTCHLRNTACVYRDFVRQRRKKYEYERSQQNGSTSRKTSIGNGDGDGDSLDLTQPPGRTSSSMQDLPNSVSATHMASPSCQMQLYYGPTSHFSLIQHVYRDLFANPTNQPGAPSREVEQAGEGLDLFSHRRIFFGAPDTHDGGKGPSSGDTSSMFLPYELAKLFLSRYLSTLYCLTPYRPRAYFEHCLDQLYSFSPVLHPDTLSQSSLLLVLAIGSLGTEYYTWGEILFERAKTLLTAFDDVNEQGRPNSTFLHLGSAARKAFSAGLHKDAPSDDIQSKESIEERRTTFWCLYFYETYAHPPFS